MTTNSRIPRPTAMTKPLSHFCSIAAMAALLLCLCTSASASAQPQNAREAENLRKTQEIAEGKMALNGPTSDTWILASWDWVKKHAVAFGKWSYEKGRGIVCDDFDVAGASPATTAAMLAIASLCLLSGAWSASIAQMRRHPKWRFFFIGLFSFFIAPVWLLFKLDIKGESERLARLADEAAQKRAAAEEEARKEAIIREEQGIEAPAVSEDGVVWDRNYFTKIARLADGTPDGPWDVRYNGVTVRVLQILDPQDDFVQARILNQEGATLNGRIPYSKIERWERVDAQ